MVCKIITIGGALSVILLRAYTERTIPALFRPSLLQMGKKTQNKTKNIETNGVVSFLPQ